MQVLKLLQAAPKVIKNMGWGYTRFRVGYEIQRKLGLLQRKFPTEPAPQQFIHLEQWREAAPSFFFFDDRAQISIPLRPNEALKKEYEAILQGSFLFFNATRISVGDYDWITNPDTGYKYDANIHWTSIEDIVPEAGDIKYVWELSRFSFLYSIIRYDYHFQEDSSEWVFDKILDWIAQNPINKGPNYKCSQEIGLRVLNWTFALFFYKNTSSLTEAKFQTILHHINWQMQHVFDNVFFSLKTVRNNHAITETLSLYLVGLLYPFLPHASIWKAKGKQWLETEIAYQIYEDGTHLLFSTNYQRTVLQLLTWFLYLSNANQEQLSDTTYQRVFAALHLLYQCQDATTGKLPNYGPNDGSLFCKLNDAPFRDFRPQLNAAYYFFTQKMLYQGAEELQEEGLWYAQNLQPLPTLQKWSLQHASTAAFQNGGYYIMRDRDSLSFLRCGSHKDRPSHADNLHLDIWYKGKNILRDAGTYKYNTSSELVKYFNGTLAHNTVQLGGYDQMEKGPRFIWLNWSQAIGAELSESEKKMYFRGRIQAFQHLKQPVYHTRQLTKYKDIPIWEIVDQVEHSTALPMQQVWNISDDFESLFQITAIDEEGNKIPLMRTKGYYSDLYGKKQQSTALIFSSTGKQIATKIQLK